MNYVRAMFVTFKANGPIPSLPVENSILRLD
nr:MAG TPA: hypothetical protein [Caudoviricetes sp.]